MTPRRGEVWWVAHDPTLAEMEVIGDDLQQVLDLI